MKKLVAVISFTLTMSINAITINVPTDQPTIQTGINAALDGDTVLVAPGTYIENLNLFGKTLLVDGIEGADNTIIQPSVDSLPTILLVSGEGLGTHIRGFTISGGNGNAVVDVDANSNLEINDCVFRDKTGTGTYYLGGGVIICHSGIQKIHRNIFLNNTGYSVGIDLGNTYCEVTNNTFYGNENGIYSNNSDIVIKNNIISNCSGIGMRYRSGDFNNLWNNNENYNQVHYEPDNWYFDPMYVDADNEDFNLLPGSRCIDAGDPSIEYLDPDGSYNDIGARWFESTTYPIAMGFNFGNGPFDSLVTSIEPTFYWTFFDTTATFQSEIEIQVTQDSTWSIVDIWQPGPISYADTSYTYDGTNLEKYKKYYVRIHVSNGTNWGDWRYSQFYTISANFLWVPYHYPSIYEASLIAEVGDTIYLDSGIYSGAGFYDLNRLGNADGIESIYGPEFTVIELDGHNFLNTGNDYFIQEQSVTGLTLKDGATALNGRYTTAINCIFENNNIGMTAGSNGGAQATDCIFKSNSVAILEEDSFTSIYSNCLFLYNGICSEHNWGENIATYYNCIIAFNDIVSTSGWQWGTVATHSIFYLNQSFGDTRWASHNIVWPTEPLPVNPNCIKADPMFCDTSLLSGISVADISPCLPENNQFNVLIGAVESACTCCRLRGDVNRTLSIDIADIVFFVEYSFANGEIPLCMLEADLDNNNNVDIADIVYFVDYSFGTGLEPVACP